jgi:hypothetical protein
VEEWGGNGARAADAGGRCHAALAEELRARLIGEAAHSVGVTTPTDSTGGAVQMVLTGSNLNGSIGFKFLQSLTDPKGIFLYSKNVK